MTKRTIKVEWGPMVSEAIEAIHGADLCYVIAHVPGKGLYVTNISKFEEGTDIEVRINTLKALSLLMTHELQGTTEFLAYLREQNPEGDKEALDITFGGPVKDNPADDVAVRGG